MPCAQIADHIQRDMNFLAANVRNLPERHHSVRAVFDHSWKLLSPTEQSALMRLSVFRGGWSVEEAAPIAGATLSLLRTLVEKSLVRVGGDGRYDLHELTRQYAADKLHAAGQEAEVQQRHGETYLALAERLFLPQVRGTQGMIAFARMMEQEADNFRAALAWVIEVGEAQTAVQLIRHLFLFWLARGYLREGLKWVDRIVATFPDLPLPLKTTALTILGILLHRTGAYQRAAAVVREAVSLAEQVGDKGALAFLFVEISFQTPDYDEAKTYLERSLALRRELGMPYGVATSLQLLGDRARIHGDFALAESLYTESVALLREVGDRFRIAYPLGNLGRLAFERGDYDQARAAFEESIGLSRAVDNKIGIADWSLRLAEVALYQEDFDQAQAALRETLIFCRETGNMSEATDALVLCAGLAVATGQYGQAARLLGAAYVALEQYHNVLEPVTPARHEDFVAATRPQLGEADFDTAYAWGRGLSIEEAIAYALEAG